MPAQLGTLIRERRQELGLTQEELAERIGENVGQAEVSRLEAGRVSLPRRLRMEQLARALQIPLGTLLLGSGWAGAEGLESAPSGTNALNPGGEVGESVRELTALNLDLQGTNESLRYANNRLRDRGAEKENDLRIAEAIVAQLRAVLNALPLPVVVVSRTGLVLVENTSYAAFSSRHTDEPQMWNAAGVRIAESDLPLERASRGERFVMSVAIDVEEGHRQAYQVAGEPASTLHGGLIGIVTFQPVPPSAHA